MQMMSSFPDSWGSVSGASEVVVGASVEEVEFSAAGASVVLVVGASDVEVVETSHVPSIS